MIRFLTIFLSERVPVGGNRDRNRRPKASERDEAHDDSKASRGYKCDDNSTDDCDETNDAKISDEEARDKFWSGCGERRFVSGVFESRI